MGTTRIGKLPDTAPWRHVVGLIADAGAVSDVAKATYEAALDGLTRSANDEGLVQSFWLLSQIALAARQDDFGATLQELDLSLPAQPNVYDLLGAFSDRLDRHLYRTAGRTDIGEMAQLAAVESLVCLLNPGAASLYGTTPVEVHRAAQELATPGGFAVLGHDFFARFTHRFLTYHLGRELSNHVGGNNRFADPHEHTEFMEELAVHCREAAAIMKGFAGGWYGKHLRREDMTVGEATGFVNYCLIKLSGVLRARGEWNGE